MSENSKKNFKVWKATDDSFAGFMVTPESAVMAGSENNFISVSAQGVAISGPVSFITTSENKRSGGFFSENPDFVKMIPGSMVTPINQQNPSPPTALYASIGRSIAYALALAQDGANLA